jgi:hypothetical protein
MIMETVERIPSDVNTFFKKTIKELWEKANRRQTFKAKRSKLKLANAEKLVNEVIQELNQE